MFSRFAHKALRQFFKEPRLLYLSNLKKGLIMSTYSIYRFSAYCF